MRLEKRRSRSTCLLIALAVQITACEPFQSTWENPSKRENAQDNGERGLTIDRRDSNRPTGPLPPLVKSHGETVYVPVYSNLSEGLSASGADIIIPLMTNVSIRNIDPDHSLTITTARYYDTAGQVLGEYLPEPRTLGPLATLTVVIKKSDLDGGVGANFLIGWQSDEQIIAPIIEAIVAGSYGTQGYAFRVPGKSIGRRGKLSE